MNESLREQVASVQEQHVFSPALLNTARFGYSRASYFFTGYTPVSLSGWVTGEPIGAIVISGSTASNGASQITQAGLNVGKQTTLRRAICFTWDDHVYWSRGRHQVEVGLCGCNGFSRTILLCAGSVWPGLFQHPADLSARHGEDSSRLCHHRRNLDGAPWKEQALRKTPSS